MSAEFFLDTNVIVYAFDESAPHKSTVAVQLIQRALKTDSGVISTQVVQEFLHLATRKFDIPMKPADAKKYLLAVLNPICRVYPDLDYFNTGLEIMAETGYSFYDSLILSGAAIAGCSTIYTEDMQAGQVVRGVRIENPFVSKGGRRKHK